MRRRDCIILFVIGTTMWPIHIRAQQLRKMPRIGVLLPGAPATWSLRSKALLDGLRDLGYVEGRTIAIEWKWGDDQFDPLSGLAADLVRSNVDVIVTGGTSATKALKTATRTIPIVMAIVGDSVAAGLVDSLARPGGNATGFSIVAPELGTKRLELLKEIVPNLFDSSAIECKEPAIEVRNEGDADGSSGDGTATLSGRNINCERIGGCICRNEQSRCAGSQPDGSDFVRPKKTNRRSRERV